MFSRYYGEKGLAPNYLGMRANQYHLFDKLQNKFSFFRGKDGNTDAQKRIDFLNTIGKILANYATSGNKDYLKDALTKVTNALEKQQFPSRKSSKNKEKTMNALLLKLKEDLDSSLSDTTQHSHLNQREERQPPLS